jgi:hypothetical protein
MPLAGLVFIPNTLTREYIRLTVFKQHYYFLYIALLVTYFIVIWFAFPEIKDLSPEEASVLLDGTDVAAKVREAGEAVTSGNRDQVIEAKIMDDEDLENDQSSMEKEATVLTSPIEKST